MTFHDGQEVVCVDDSSSHRTGVPFPGLYSGHLYVMRGFSRHAGEDPDFRLLIEGLFDTSGERTKHGDEPGFDPRRFRPLIERSTDISIFTSLLDPSNHTPLPEQQPERRKVSHDLCGNE